MKNVSEGLIKVLEHELSCIHTTSDNPVVYAEKALKTTIKTIEELKTIFSKHTFKGKEDEIEFFKIIKPRISSKLIYYNEVYNLEVSKPSGTAKTIKRYYEKEQSKLKDFFKANKEFYKYYRSGNTCLDKKYFLRRKHNIRLTLDSAYFQSDYSFATSHDFKVAQIMAYEDFQNYLEAKVVGVQNTDSKKTQMDHISSNLKWTGTKVALVELMYALHTEGVLNNGNLSLNETAKNIEILFNIEIGQFNRIFSEIKKRKTIEPTSFLNNLKQNLTKRIQEADEI